MKAVVSATLAVLALSATSVFAADIVGDAAAGKSKNAMCIGCHSIPGYQASFPEVHKVPMIAGQNAAYIGAALHAYKKGDRKHPTMRGIADTLNDQDIADLAAYYAAEAGQPAGVPETPAAPDAKTAELLTKGGCVACHGVNFNKPVDGSYPKIAGQHADFLYVALKAYKTEKNPQVGRNNAIMAATAKNFSNDELKTLAKYIGSLPGDLKTVPQSRFR
ncbi:c-type cytochrome [Aquariibacter albus]|uniref:Cytochrome c4 n=1 Tax=Aquariibacter albus TaxID=2759899 RepID=A0A839HMB1_9BURK|nr:c-type cytochrome [Aquariibacter albus]MBB1160708.1 cytochrome c4 [Aquariibacter albus]